MKMRILRFLQKMRKTRLKLNRKISMRSKIKRKIIKRKKRSKRRKKKVFPFLFLLILRLCF